MNEYISKKAAIEALKKQVYVLNLTSFGVDCPLILIDDALNVMVDLPSVRCKDCKHRPSGTGEDHDLDFPNDICPCQCLDDYWYSWKPDDDWCCADWERSEE